MMYGRIYIAGFLFLACYNIEQQYTYYELDNIQIRPVKKGFEIKVVDNKTNDSFINFLPFTGFLEDEELNTFISKWRIQ